MKKNVYLHMGCHKTASTSIQKFLHDKKKELNKMSIGVLETSNGSGRHVKLNQSVLRKEIAKFTHPHINVASLNKSYGEKIGQFIQKDYKSFLFSDEGLDFIRTQEEVNNLIRLFPDDVNIIPIIVIRDSESWKESWLNYLKNVNNDLDSDKFKNKNSPYFLNEGSWFFDIDKLLELLNKNFDNVIEIKYSDNMLNKFFSIFDIKVEKEYKLNVTKNK